MRRKGLPDAQITTYGVRFHAASMKPVQDMVRKTWRMFGDKVTMNPGSIYRNKGIMPGRLHEFAGVLSRIRPLHKELYEAAQAF